MLKLNDFGLLQIASPTSNTMNVEHYSSLDFWIQFHIFNIHTTGDQIQVHHLHNIMQSGNFSTCFCQKIRTKNSGGREHFVPRLALEIQRSISGWDLPSWLPSLLNFTNILASLAWSRGSPNIHKVLKNDSKRKENVQKGSPVVFTTQNSLKVLRIESVVPRFLLFPAITFPSQNEQNRVIS